MRGKGELNAHPPRASLKGKSLEKTVRFCSTKNRLGWRSSQSHVTVDHAPGRATGVQISHSAPILAQMAQW